MNPISEIKKLSSELSNGGEFSANYARIFNLSFEYDKKTGISAKIEKNAGNLRQLVAATINKIINVKIDDNRFTFNTIEKDKVVEQWTRGRVYSRHLKSGKYDLEAGKVISQEKEIECLGGTFRVPIPGTNLQIVNISLSDGHHLWIWVEAKGHNSESTTASTKEQAEIDRILED